MYTAFDSRLSVHTLTSDTLLGGAGAAEEEQDQALINIFTLACRIFSSGNPEQDAKWPSTNLSVWQSYIHLTGSFILYTTDHDSSRPLGFLFILPKTQPEIGRAMPHIWLAGVDPLSRGLGVFALLVEEAKSLMRHRGEEGMTICTYPKKFEKMYRILTLNGWEEVAWRENREKVLMKLGV